MYLVDTCVFSEFARPNPEQKVREWARSVPESDVYLSVLVLGELLRGIERLPTGSKRTALGQWISGLFDTHRSRLVAVDADVSRKWASMCASAERIGKPVAAIDSLIAAQASAHGFVLVTRNTADFIAFDISLLNPWK